MSGPAQGRRPGIACGARRKGKQGTIINPKREPVGAGVTHRQEQQDPQAEANGPAAELAGSSTA